MMSGSIRLPSCKIHHVLARVVDLYCLLDAGKPGLVISVEHARRFHVVLLVYDVVPGPDSHQVGVVGGGGDGDAPGAPGVCVAQLVSQLLELVSAEAVIIPETAIVARSRGALNALVRAEVEVILGGVSDVGVHRGPGRDVTRPPRLVPVV